MKSYRVSVCVKCRQTVEKTEAAWPLKDKNAVVSNLSTILTDNLQD